MSASPPSVGEMVEALCLFDEPMLNSRYHALLLRREELPGGAGLGRLPGLVLQCEWLAREGAIAWDRGRGARSDATEEFVAWAEYTVMDAFLQLSESQLRVAAHIARSAPEAESRRPFDEMCIRHREISRVLRHALKALPRPHASVDAPTYRRNVQEEEGDGDFRGQLEAAVRAASASGAGVRHIVLSPTGLRHLRDQGCFRSGDAEFAGNPVSVDFGWDAPAFVIETYDRVSLDEILRTDELDDVDRPPLGRHDAAVSPG